MSTTSEIAEGLSFWAGLTAVQRIELTEALLAARAAGIERHRELAAMSDDELARSPRSNR